MKIAFGSDHAGFQYKEALIRYVTEAGHVAQDYGTYSPDSVDYPDFAVAVGNAVAQQEADVGILICGSGIGVSITANKIAGVRAANCLTVEMARLARQHNNANVLTLGERLLSLELAQAVVQAFLETPFEGGRHQRRVEKIHALTGC
ncbi:MAG: ribose 5-phosphate isomerase B [Bacteroidota bacterium]|nr:ribose 5-phosphate isomerase B [Bacteroidota bacterium]